MRESLSNPAPDHVDTKGSGLIAKLGNNASPSRRCFDGVFFWVSEYKKSSRTLPPWTLTLLVVPDRGDWRMRGVSNGISSKCLPQQIVAKRAGVVKPTTPIYRKRIIAAPDPALSPSSSVGVRHDDARNLWGLFSTKEREQTLEMLLSRERVLTLLYSRVRDRPVVWRPPM